MRVAATGAVLAALLTAGACTTQPGPPRNPLNADPLPASRVDVDAPSLVRFKESAGIRPCPVTDPDAAPVEGGLPAATLPCLGGGRPVHLAGLRGTPMVLNLWASWCAPCREELPVLQRFDERAAGDVAVLGVDYEDTQPGAALQLLEHSGVTYPQVADLDKALDEALGQHPVPMTVLVNARGRIVAELPIQVTSVGQLAHLVEQSLGVRV